jgi:hypothetical protein
VKRVAQFKIGHHIRRFQIPTATTWVVIDVDHADELYYIGRKGDNGNRYAGSAITLKFWQAHLEYEIISNGVQTFMECL